jgi:hypothetical protein
MLTTNQLASLKQTHTQLLFKTTGGHHSYGTSLKKALSKLKSPGHLEKSLSNFAK